MLSIVDMYMSVFGGSKKLNFFLCFLMWDMVRLFCLSLVVGLDVKYGVSKT